jgi:transposase
VTVPTVPTTRFTMIKSGLSLIAWLNRCRRLAKDFENLNRNALAFLRLASIRLMLRKLCNP